jgi:hypothetical protein
MIAELITPLVLATAPMTIQAVEPFKYDHTTQTAVASEGVVVAQRMPTFNGTQTFDYSGRPWDADND